VFRSPGCRSPLQRGARSIQLPCGPDDGWLAGSLPECQSQIAAGLLLDQLAVPAAPRPRLGRAVAAHVDPAARAARSRKAAARDNLLHRLDLALEDVLGLAARRRGERAQRRRQRLERRVLVVEALAVDLRAVADGQLPGDAREPTRRMRDLPRARRPVRRGARAAATRRGGGGGGRRGCRPPWSR